MADTNEEQLLNDLLGEVAASDTHATPADLEARVLAAWDAGITPSKVRIVPRAAYVFCGVAAVVTLAVTGATIAPTSALRATVGKPGAPTSAPRATVGKPVVPVAPTSALRATVGKPLAPIAPVAPVAPVAPIAPIAPVAPVAPIAPIAPVAPVSAGFVPLMPIAEQELTGPFQIVRVQMPRSSLGASMSPIEHPSDLIEADVLLGQDGMARAIRVSTESIYPWRSR
jgi:hypothetical protein